MLETGSFVTLAGHGDAQEGDLELGFEIDLALHLRRGHDVLINDGLMRLRVVEARERRVHCSVEIGGLVSSNKGVNLPGTYLPIPAITQADRDNLEFALDQRGRLRGAVVRAPPGGGRGPQEADPGGRLARPRDLEDREVRGDGAPRRDHRREPTG